MACPLTAALSEEDKKSELYKWTVGTHYGMKAADVKSLYNQGAGEYDSFYVKTGWLGPLLGAQLLSEMLPKLSIDKDCKIIDVGAGTGLAGEELVTLGYSELTGVDIAEEMLMIAREKGVYKHTEQMDLYEADLSPYMNKFDAAISIGTFTAGQLRPEILGKVAGLVRTGGVVVISFRDITWQNVESGFAQKVTELEESGVWTLMEKRILPYHRKLEEDAYYLALIVQ